MEIETLIEKLYEINVVKLGRFTLKSGIESPIYIDLRQIISYPKILRAVAHAMWNKVTGVQHDLICGVPYTALPIATCLSLDYEKPMLIYRKETKDYGTKKRVEGLFEKGQTCLVIEDVVTTGGSVIKTAESLQEEGLTVRDIVVFVDREDGGREKIEEKGFFLHSVITLSQLLNTLKASPIIKPEELRALEELSA